MKRCGMMGRRILAILLAAIVLVGCATTGRRMAEIGSAHPEWNQATIEKLARWEIEPGMTREMVQAALGKPDAVFREGEEEAWGYAVWVVTIWWHYQRIAYVVYFKDDKVIRTRGDVNRIQTVY
ncbi:MAG: outer membrane protein assembly factor BamE [Desulfobacteraceae bacterium]|nr:MAG: outer membrane protein assembly factor BamE [Desulfobacteraceae bacterium]